MDERLVQTNDVYLECQNHLSTEVPGGSPIESYLTEHILVVLCAEMQQVARQIADQRAQRSTDPAIHTFVTAAGERILRSVRKDELSAFVGLFGSTYKDDFNARLDEREVSVYNNAVRQRHAVAHRGGGSVSFSDLREAIDAANNILNSMENALSR